MAEERKRQISRAGPASARTHILHTVRRCLRSALRNPVRLRKRRRAVKGGPLFPRGHRSRSGGTRPHPHGVPALRRRRGKTGISGFAPSETIFNSRAAGPVRTGRAASGVTDTVRSCAERFSPHPAWPANGCVRPWQRGNRAHAPSGTAGRRKAFWYSRNR